MRLRVRKMLPQKWRIVQSGTIRRFFTVPLLLCHAHRNAPVLLPALFGRVVGHGVGFAVALCFEAVWGNAELDLLSHYVFGALLRESEVMRRVSCIVRIA